MTKEEIKNFLENEIGEKKLEKMLKTIIKKKQAQKIAKDNVKEYEDRMIEDYATAKQFYKKDNKTLDLAKIKKTILKKAILVERGEPNKLAEELALLEDYLKDIKSNEPSKAAIDGYMKKEEVFVEVTGELKDIEKEYMEQVPKEVVKAISKIADAKIKEELDSNNEAESTQEDFYTILFSMLRGVQKD